MTTEFSTPFRQPTSYTNADFDSSHATPLLLYGYGASKQLKQHQDDLDHKFGVVTHEILDGVVGDSAVNLVAHSIHNRMKLREGLNTQVYAKRRYKTPRYDLAPDQAPIDIQWACYQARFGNGSLEDNELAGIVHGTQSSELGNITVIGDFRAEENEAFVASVNRFLGKAAMPETIADYDKIRVLQYDRNIHHTNSQHIGAIRLGLSSTLGPSDRGSTVKLRSSVVIDTSPSSGFNQETVDKFLGQRYHGELSQRAFRWLIEAEQPHIRELARNNTVYRV